MILSLVLIPPEIESPDGIVFADNYVRPVHIILSFTFCSLLFVSCCQLNDSQSALYSTV